MTTPPELSRLERLGMPQIVILLDGSTWRHEGDCVWTKQDEPVPESAASTGDGW